MLSNVRPHSGRSQQDSRAFRLRPQTQGRDRRENVFIFSISNPSVPAPDAVAESIAELIKEPPCTLHGYTPSPGAAGPRQAVADNISRRFGIEATADQVYLTAGAPLASPSASTRLPTLGTRSW